MHGLTNIGNWLVAVGMLSSTACNEQSDREFEFQLVIGNIPTQSDVHVDDSEAILSFIPDAQSPQRSLQISRSYSTYSEAKVRPLTVQFTLPDGTVSNSQTQVGVCERDCTHPLCPLAAEISLEVVRVSDEVFVPFEYVCYECEGGGKNRASCAGVVGASEVEFGR